MEKYSTFLYRLLRKYCIAAIFWVIIPTSLCTQSQPMTLDMVNYFGIADERVLTGQIQFEAQERKLMQKAYQHFNDYQQLNKTLLSISQDGPISGTYFVESFRVPSGKALTLIDDFYLFSKGDVFIDGNIFGAPPTMYNEHGQNLIINALGTIYIRGDIHLSDGGNGQSKQVILASRTGDAFYELESLYQSSLAGFNNESSGGDGGNLMLWASNIVLLGQINPGNGGHGFDGGSGGDGGGIVLLTERFYSNKKYPVIVGGNGGNGGAGSQLHSGNGGNGGNVLLLECDCLGTDGGPGYDGCSSNNGQDGNPINYCNGSACGGKGGDGGVGACCAGGSGGNGGNATSVFGDANGGKGGNGALAGRDCDNGGSYPGGNGGKGGDAIAGGNYEKGGDANGGDGGSGGQGYGNGGGGNGGDGGNAWGGNCESGTKESIFQGNKTTAGRGGNGYAGGGGKGGAGGTGHEGIGGGNGGNGGNGGTGRGGNGCVGYGGNGGNGGNGTGRRGGERGRGEGSGQYGSWGKDGDGIGGNGGNGTNCGTMGGLGGLGQNEEITGPYVPVFKGRLIDGLPGKDGKLCPQGAGWKCTNGVCISCSSFTNEICNNEDDDCNGIADDNLPILTFYYDYDNDGYGDTSIRFYGCEAPNNHYVLLEGDCDDNNKYITTGETWYKDKDNDNFSNGSSQVQCTRPSSYKLQSELIAISGDCNDENPNINPEVKEICGNQLDDDCDGTIDKITFHGNVNNLCKWNKCISKIEGDLIIAPTYWPFRFFRCKINSLELLSNLEEITGNLTIRSTNLSNLNGLENLKKIGGNLTIISNSKLSDCCAINQLATGVIGKIGKVKIGRNKKGCNSLKEILSTCKKK